MGRMYIVEEKADKMVDKLEDIKEAVCEMIECFAEAMEGHRYSEDGDGDWDDEYEVKRRKAYRRGMMRGMSGTSGNGGRISRF